MKEKLERDAFESSNIIDNPSNVLLSKNALEVQMQHRFGLVNSESGNDLAGFWGDANIRIGLSYGIHERLTIGYGTTKFNRLQDFNWKLSLLASFFLVLSPKLFTEIFVNSKDLTLMSFYIIGIYTFIISYMLVITYVFSK